MIEAEESALILGYGRRMSGSAMPEGRHVPTGSLVMVDMRDGFDNDKTKEGTGRRVGEINVADTTCSCHNRGSRLGICRLDVIPRPSTRRLKIGSSNCLHLAFS